MGRSARDALGPMVPAGDIRPLTTSTAAEKDRAQIDSTAPNLHKEHHYGQDPEKR